MTSALLGPGIGSAQDSKSDFTRHDIVYPLCIAQNGFGGWTDFCQGTSPRSYSAIPALDPLTDTAKNLAQFVRTHEKALANALQSRRQPPKNGQATGHSGEASPTQISSYQSPAPASSTSSALAAAFSLGALGFSSHNLKPAKLTLSPHHLYYLLDRFEEVGIPIGPMNVRLENIHTEASPANYVSFLSQSQRSHGRSDRDSIHSVSSVRNVMSGMSSLWSGFGLGSSTIAAKTEKAKTQQLADLRYLYSAFTKIPCLRLSPDRKAHLIGGYEEFPFDTAVPLLAFKNVSVLEICDVDFRQFYGWDKLAEQLRSLTVKRSHLDDPTDLFINVVLDDMEKRRRRSSKAQSSPILPWPASPTLRFSDVGRANSTPPSPMVDDRFGQSASPKRNGRLQQESEVPVPRQRPRTNSGSPTRPSSSRQDGSFRHIRPNLVKVKRSGSGSSNSSTQSSGALRSGSSSNLLTLSMLPASKWRFLRHVSLADNSLTSVTALSLTPLSNTLHSLDLSSNLFTEIPDCLATLTALRALNLSNCMIESLHSLTRNPLPAITALNLRANRLVSIAGVERLLCLERLDLRDNRIQDPTELARLTGTPNIMEIWVMRNPFVKTHSNYRVSIFNLFRSTPGYTEDIMIDSSAPGYSERRQLRVRVVEPEGFSVAKELPVEPTPNPPVKTDGTPYTAANGEAQGLQRPSPPQTIQSELAIGSGRRRKGPRRRIVDLAGDESPPVVQRHDSIEVPTDAERPSLTRTSTDDNSPRTHPHLLQTLQMRSTALTVDTPKAVDTYKCSPTDVSDKGRSLATEIKSLNLDGEAYRQKVEALKGEVGSNWLSVLSEEGWQQHQKVRAPSPHFNHVGMMRPVPSIFRASSQGIVSGGGTIG